MNYENFTEIFLGGQSKTDVVTLVTRLYSELYLMNELNE